jgi:hypothetical protein
MATGEEAEMERLSRPVAQRLDEIIVDEASNAEYAAPDRPHSMTMAQASAALGVSVSTLRRRLVARPTGDGGRRIAQFGSRTVHARREMRGKRTRWTLEFFSEARSEEAVRELRMSMEVRPRRWWQRLGRASAVGVHFSSGGRPR